jgi:hypothetical protein
MTVRRFSPKERVELVDRDGHVLGALVSISIDLYGEGDTGGGASPEEQQTAKLEGERKTPLPPEIEEVWAHYVRVFSAERQTLNKARIRVIRNALKVRSVAECKLAIDGLRVSPHHNGENPDGTKYLDIRYALKGNQTRGESDEERIDRMGEKAPAHSLSPNLPRKVAIRLDNVQRWVASGRSRETRRSKESKAELEEMGYTVTELEEAPWVNLSRERTA